MRKIMLVVIAGLLAQPGPAAGAPAKGADIPTGIWTNPKKTVQVQMQPCGASVCGTVVWANEKAKTDAMKGGTKRLVGTQLFREFVPLGPKAWKGRVFLPDMNRTFAGQMKMVDASTITGRGCLIGGFFCKTQTWRRVR